MNLHRTTRALICATILVLTAGCSTQNESESSTSAASNASSVDQGDSTADQARRTMGSPEQATSSAEQATSSADQATSSADQATGSLVATGNKAEVAVHEEPGDDATETFENPTPTGVPLTFMVISKDKEWVEVQLPVRPNGRTAWVPLDEVTITEVDYALKVSTKERTLQLYQDEELIESFEVATGTGGTPTPKGTYYLTELITPTNEGYGPFAYGISAFSEELTSFGGGPGQIGLHGTDDEDSIGRAVSNGCIRLTNPAITKLSALLPLGTPIEIT